MRKNTFKRLTLILAQASCVDSIPRRSLIIIDPRYWVGDNQNIPLLELQGAHKSATQRRAETTDAVRLLKLPCRCILFKTGGRFHAIDSKNGLTVASYPQESRMSFSGW